MPATSEFYYRHILLYRELVTEEELAHCTELQDQARGEGRAEPGLTDLLLELGYLSPSQFQRIEGEIARLTDDQKSGYTGPQIPGYRIEELVNEHATGLLYNAQQKSLRRNVHIKVLNPEFLTDRLAVLSYYREAAEAAKAGHPNIVQLIDLGFDPNGALYIIRERVDGETVAGMLESKGRFDPDEAAQLILNVARGLAYIHDIGLTHGHLRPSNIVVPPDRIAKLQDLGITSTVPESADGTGRKRLLGNPLYMSPEQLRNDPDIGPSGDIYSLGATAYHMIAGRPPFLGANAKEVFDQHLNAKPVPPHKLQHDIPRKLSKLIVRMLGKTPAERFPSADELVAELEAFVRKRARLLASARVSGRRPAYTPPPEPPPPPPPPPPIVPGKWWAVLGGLGLGNAGLAAWYLLR